MAEALRWRLGNTAGWRAADHLLRAPRTPPGTASTHLALAAGLGRVAAAGVRCLALAAVVRRVAVAGLRRLALAAGLGRVAAAGLTASVSPLPSCGRAPLPAWPASRRCALP